MFESVLKKRQVYEFFNRELKPEDGGKFFARLA